jgi:beta-glucosidase-like glycosyl hydrolase
LILLSRPLFQFLRLFRGILWRFSRHLALYGRSSPLTMYKLLKANKTLSWTTGEMADLATQPRWYRVHETFTEDADLNANIMKSLVVGLQGGPVNPKTAAALTMKHFPGGGPQELGLDPHYSFGKYQVYPGNNFAYHLKPFMGAINAGVSAIMQATTHLS